MSFKDMLKIFPQDKLSHYQWASWFSTAAATVAILCARYAFGLSMGPTALSGALASVVVAALAGALGELSDELANMAADDEGKPAPHEVSIKDFVASALGAMPVSVPLFLLVFVT